MFAILVLGLILVVIGTIVTIIAIKLIPVFILLGFVGLILYLIFK